jgi:NAD(P)-dependent dehydrogenase (short-subunit alcohol dehydrogenase family)
MEAQEPRTVPLRRGDRDVGRGSIVHVLSANSLAVTPGKLPYVLSKHASLAVTKTAAIESAAKGIRVNYVAPTWTRTQMYDVDCENVPATGDIVKALVRAASFSSDGAA